MHRQTTVVGQFQGFILVQDRAGREQTVKSPTGGQGIVSRRGVGNGRAEEQIGSWELKSRQTDRDSTSGGRSGRRRVGNRKSGRWIRRRGQRSRQADRDWTAGRWSDRRGFVNRQSGVDKVNQKLRESSE